MTTSSVLRTSAARVAAVALACELAPRAYARALDPNTGECPSKNKTACVDGVLIPRWWPYDMSVGDRIARATVYFAILMYLFLGVSIIADRFMSAIEVITSKERNVKVKSKSGDVQIVSVRIWNETVSNLTLMALGSSAPEILLSIIEIFGRGFDAGDLGPGTIVGSAAFNLFIIIGICVYVIPDNEVRRIKHLSVFFITATWSVFAYLWLYLIISQITPGFVDSWEAILTFLFFPLTVLTAYIADTKIFFRRFLRKKYSVGGHKSLAKTDADLELQTNHVHEMEFKGFENEDDEVKEFENHRQEFITILREIRKKNPSVSPKELEEMAQMEVLSRGPKSRAFYRIQATRQLTGSGNVIKKSKVERKMSLDDDKPEEIYDGIERIYFDPGHYTVMENCGTCELIVSRKGDDDLARTLLVDYVTEDGTAKRDEDYVFTSGTLTFHAGQRHNKIDVPIIDDDEYEEDEHFYVRLENVRTFDGYNAHPVVDKGIQISLPNPATVMVLDDDHGGIFHFEECTTHCIESCGVANVKVVRTSGARGVVTLPYYTIDGTAKGNGKDYESVEGHVIFHNNETEKTIHIPITNDEEYEKHENFYVQLGDPVAHKNGENKPAEELCEDHKSKVAGNNHQDLEELGLPRLGEISKIEVWITESTEFKNTVDKLLKKGNMTVIVGTSSWREQFVEAITVNAGEGGDENDNEDRDEQLPSCMDYVMHFLTVFWKVLFACVPPTDYGSGWYCFTVSIIMIGALTAVIGDVASGFGCTVGLTDAVTSITFVALGTSLPDTFASKVAAIGDSYADSSIGNVTGSNGVNVFLGIGIAWSIAAIYHESRGGRFRVEPGSLGFSVTIFCVCAMLAIVMIVSRRRKSIGGELGGPRRHKIPTTLFLFSLWITYVVLSSLENYCHIRVHI